MRNVYRSSCFVYLSLIALLLLASGSTLAQEGEAVTAELSYYALDNVILLFCAILVLMMQLKIINLAAPAGQAPLQTN